MVGELQSPLTTQNERARARECSERQSNVEKLSRQRRERDPSQDSLYCVIVVSGVYILRF
jgi:hypothetical protein